MLANIRALATCIFSVASIVTIAASATAATNPDQLSQTVSYADLDLKTEQGIARLNQRVRAALTGVCGKADARDLNARAQVMACRQVAAGKAQANVQLAVAAARSDTQLAVNSGVPSIKVDAH